ncbi:hypothetical protein [Mechercharimyces sp. CAU 1602]|uniref:hypothetical protein n=1 Tax=Mechercharimyces sp. CAU 1602 TaxID=2973933 RepID=UPI002162FB88|nr:hypothetical protein [Mechercharimyces sp. CAU 1602]MCS1351624.1 hypothetical protein [Mechercharimyces sp. CAU 1602]
MRVRSRLLVAFIFGSLIGAIGTLFIFGQKLDNLYLERAQLYYSNNQKQKEIVRLTDEIEKYAQKDLDRQEQADLIEKFQIELISEQRFKQEDIKEEVATILDPFIGKSMKWISTNPEMLDNMLTDRTIYVSGTGNSTIKVNLSLKYLVFEHSTLRIWVEAKKIEE